MKYEAKCTWGDGPDILLKIDNQMFDLSLAQAESLVKDLLFSIQEVKNLNQICIDHDELYDMKNHKYDMKNHKCLVKKCKGVYIETSLHDDWDGKLHCSKCNNEIKRYKKMEDRK